MPANSLNNFYRYYFPAILWAMAIFIGSSIPSASIPKLVIKVKDLFLHFIEFAIFGVLLSHALLKSPKRRNFKLGMTVILIGVLYGASDEIHQKFVPGRMATVHDFLADGAGVIFGWGVYLLFPWIKRLFKRVNEPNSMV
ncbi:MAG: VanZ family protein [bacterium]